jgi:hypothetical protein
MDERDVRYANLLADMARLDATYSAVVPHRIVRAWRNTDPETVLSPLRASTGTGCTGGGISDPVGQAVVPDGDTPPPQTQPTPTELADVRNNIDRLVRRRERDLNELARILNRYAPNPPKDSPTGENDVDGWCTNHLRHNKRVATSTRHGKDRTRGAGGLCGFCRQILDRWSTPPNAELIRLHDRGLRLSDATIQRTLGTPGLAQPDPPLSNGPGPAESNPPPVDQPAPPPQTPPLSGHTPGSSGATVAESRRMTPGQEWD